MSCRLKLFFIGAFFLVFIGKISYAQQEKQDSLLNLSLEELLNVNISTGSRIEKPLHHSPAIISTFTKEDISKMGVTSLIDILKYVPNIEVLLGAGGKYRLAFRGKRQDGIILVLLNGQAINNPYDGTSVLDIPHEQIQKIEVLRGAGSAVYGNLAIMGVINIITNRTQNDVSVRLGTNGTFGSNTNIHLNTLQSDIFFNVGYFETQGPHGEIKQDKSSDNPWSLTYQNKALELNRFSKNYYVNSGIKNKEFTLNINAFSNEYQPWVGYNYVAAPNGTYKQDQIVMNADYNYDITPTIQLKPRIYGSYLTQNNNVQEAPSGYVSSISSDLFPEGKFTANNYDIFNAGGEIVSRFELFENVNIVLGNVFEAQKVLKFDINRNYKIRGDSLMPSFGNHDNLRTYARDKERSIFAYFLEADIKLNKFSIIGGYRFDSYSDFGQTINPRASIIFNPNETIYFKTIFGTAFRAPTFKELYDQSELGSQGTKGNSELKAQTLTSIEFEYGILLEKITFKSSIFMNTMKRLISDTIGTDVNKPGKYANTGYTESYGTDLEISIPFSKRFNLSTNMSIQKTFFFWDSDLKAEYYAYKGAREMKNIPQFKANLMLDYTYNKWTLFTGINYGSSSTSNNRNKYEGDIKDVFIPSYAQLNFSVAYKPIDKLSIKVAANNIGTKYSAPDESININAFGNSGLMQPHEIYTLSIKYVFNSPLNKLKAQTP